MPPEQPKPPVVPPVSPPVQGGSTINQPAIKPRTPQQQSWGTVISIIIIMLMIIVGAFYAWGQKVAEERAIVQQLTATTTAR